MYTTYHFTLALTGTTGNQDSPRPYAGEVVGVYLKYTGQATPTTVLKTKGSNVPSLTILSVASAGTDGWFFPKISTVKAADASAIAAWFDEPPIDDALNLAVTSGGQTGSIDVWFIVEN